jgi:CheY-like chemotaxis protein
MISSMTMATINHAAPTLSRPLRVLVCEDVEETRGLFVHLLRTHGYDARGVSSGVAAVDAVRAGDIDVALVDIGLPDISGLEVAALIRKAVLPRHVRLIAVTGYGSAADRASSQLAGFDAHLTKPIRLRELVTAIWAGAGVPACP